jgi:hypothetical protein
MVNPMPSTSNWGWYLKYLHFSGKMRCFTVDIGFTRSLGNLVNELLDIPKLPQISAWLDQGIWQAISLPSH